MNPDHLLDLARDQIGTALRRPRMTDLRRAISNCYYAVFHEMCSLVANTLVGTSRRGTEDWALVYRAVSHGQAKNRLKRLTATSVEPTIINIASTFVTLQEERHTADYDPIGFAVGRTVAQQKVNEAHTAISNLRALSSEQKIFLSVRILFDVR